MPLIQMIIVISIITSQALVGIETLVRVEILIEVMEEKVEDLLAIHLGVPLMEVLLVVGGVLDLLFLGKIMVTIVLEGQVVVEALEVQVEEEVVQVVVGEGAPPLLPLPQVVMSTTGDS